jgi:hypothetical protein
MKLEPSTFCPLIKDECKKLGCGWFTQLRGTNPNTGKEIDEWGCAVTWLPLLLIENSQMQRHTGAAVESFRNEMVKANDSSRQVLLATVGADIKMIGG